MAHHRHRRPRRIRLQLRDGRTIGSGGVLWFFAPMLAMFVPPRAVAVDDDADLIIEFALVNGQRTNVRIP